MLEGLRGSTKEYQKLDTATQDGQFPRQSIETDWNVFRNLRLTLYALAVLLGSSQEAQLTRLLTFQSCLESSQSERGHEDYSTSDYQTANEARLEIEYYVHTRMRVPILI